MFIYFLKVALQNSFSKIIFSMKKRLIKLYLQLKYLPFHLFCKKPHILSFDETISNILSRKSLARFGDGEIRMVLDLNEEIGFQKKCEKLSRRLQEVLKTDNENVLICLPNTFGLNFNFNTDSQIFWLGFNFNYAARFCRFLNIPNERKFGNALITRFYMPFKDKSEVAHKVAQLKKIWNNKEIVIIEGEASKLGIGNDLFNNSKSLTRIICPAKNAFDKYNEILDAAKRFGKNKLILIALGPTATVLAHDLAVEGYWALDIGHIDVEYMWYLNNDKQKNQISGKAVNEAVNKPEIKGSFKEEVKAEDPVYKESILCVIK